ncbi:uncharacterized protein FA14DRAFT_180508 [Meira miltonrushii]|uniref:HTH APSES-type domain-containing protein n=1 Tax=Meira miltonrushii TaxID=1280837 RepID=A0A316V8T8_9BASI|nr:uncharacterized protein FA14DRAFT_180508 [Meira miltonrushii]PWN33872.1 hypothetical protein FA14DRAFT_180508 [Meira miltonrushii]
MTAKVTSFTNMYTMHKPELCFPGSSSPLKTPLPSLASQIEIPDPHPDYELILKTIRAQRAKLNGLEDHEGQGAPKTSDSSIHSSPTPSPGTPPSADGRHTNQTVIVGSDSMAGQVIDLETVQKQQTQLCAKSTLDAQMTNNQMLNGLPQAYNSVRRTNCGLLAPQSLFEMSFARPALIHATNRHKIVSNKYATAADPRGYIPVYEYEINNTTILIDQENSYILLTSICKALGPWRTDIVRQVEAVPELESLCRRIRGGFLKIQGTWVPYKLAYELCRRVAHNIRMDLVPIFGFDFPEKCLSPVDVGFGELRILTNGRRGRKSTVAAMTAMNNLPVHIKDKYSHSIAVANASMAYGNNSGKAGAMMNVQSSTPLANTTNQHANFTAMTNSAAPFTSRVVLRPHPYAVRSKLAFLANRKMMADQQYALMAQQLGSTQQQQQAKQQPIMNMSQPSQRI